MKIDMKTQLLTQLHNYLKYKNIYIYHDAEHDMLKMTKSNQTTEPHIVEKLLDQHSFLYGKKLFFDFVNYLHDENICVPDIINYLHLYESNVIKVAFKMTNFGNYNEQVITNIKSQEVLLHYFEDKLEVFINHKNIIHLFNKFTEKEKIHTMMEKVMNLPSFVDADIQAVCFNILQYKGIDTQIYSDKFTLVHTLDINNLPAKINTVNKYHTITYPLSVINSIDYSRKSDMINVIMQTGRYMHNLVEYMEKHNYIKENSISAYFCTKDTSISIIDKEGLMVLPKLAACTPLKEGMLQIAITDNDVSLIFMKKALDMLLLKSLEGQKNAIVAFHEDVLASIIAGAQSYVLYEDMSNTLPIKSTTEKKRTKI